MSVLQPASPEFGVLLYTAHGLGCFATKSRRHKTTRRGSLVLPSVFVTLSGELDLSKGPHFENYYGDQFAAPERINQQNNVK